MTQQKINERVYVDRRRYINHMLSFVLQPGARLDTSNGQHQYYIHDRPVAGSVTQRIDEDIMKKTFNAPIVARAIFKLCERIRATPDGVYTDDQLARFAQYKDFASAQDIVNAWAENRDRGTATHKLIELFLNGALLRGDAHLRTPEMDVFFAFYDHFIKTHEPVGTECAIVYEELDFGGCVDAIWRKRDGDPFELVFIDWKKMGPVLLEDVSSSSNRCSFYQLPVGCKRAKQEIQMNMYAEMTRRVTSYRVVQMLVVYLDVENGLDIGVVEDRRDATAAYFDTLLDAKRNPLLLPAEQSKPLRGFVKRNKR